MAGHALNVKVSAAAMVAIVVVAIMCVSAEASSCPPGQRDLVHKMYRQALNRDPDTGGLAAYCRHLQSGQSVRSLFAAIVKSREFKKNNVFGKSTFFAVAQIYKVVLNRCPDGRGIVAWEGQLRKNCRANFDWIVDRFFSSDEYNRNFGNNIVPFPKPPGICLGRPPQVSNVVYC